MTENVQVGYFSKNGELINEMYNSSKSPKVNKNKEGIFLNGTAEQDSVKTIGGGGLVSCDILEGISLYERRLSVGNVFTTKERVGDEVIGLGNIHLIRTQGYLT